MACHAPLICFKLSSPVPVLTKMSNILNNVELSETKIRHLISLSLRMLKSLNPLQLFDNARKYAIITVMLLYLQFIFPNRIWWCKQDLLYVINKKTEIKLILTYISYPVLITKWKSDLFFFSTVYAKQTTFITGLKLQHLLCIYFQSVYPINYNVKIDNNTKYMKKS